MVIFGAGFWGWQMSGHTIRGLGPVSVPPLYESVVAAAPKRRVPSARVSLSRTVRRLRHGRAVRAIWKPDVNGPARRRTNDQTPGLEPGDRHSLPNQTGRPRRGTQSRRPTTPVGTTVFQPGGLSFDVVSRATVIEIAGLPVNSAPVMRPGQLRQ